MEVWRSQQKTDEIKNKATYLLKGVFTQQQKKPKITLINLPKMVNLPIQTFTTSLNIGQFANLLVSHWQIYPLFTN